VPSSVTISAPRSGSPRCSTAGALASDESAARTLSVDTAAADVPDIYAGQPLDFCAAV
jgi:hypothetical protein